MDLVRVYEVDKSPKMSVARILGRLYYITEGVHGPIGSLVLNYLSMSRHDRYNANKLDIKLPEYLRSAPHQLVVIVYRTNRGL
jgi:hypothetical protein